MNRIRIILSIFVLIFLFLAPRFSSTPLRGAFAQEEELSIKEVGATVSGDAKTTKTIEYELPYPGLLPDNPLYFLKAARDRIVDFLISDPLKKADFALLQADKRLNVGAFLVKEDKHQLAESTISKGENYFEKAINKVEEARKQGVNTKDIATRLYTASKKHQEVLKNLKKDVKDANIKGSLSNIEKRLMGFEKKAKSLMQK